jgi:ribosomal protein S18 acetylase RimI-like enzyme
VAALEVSYVESADDVRPEDLVGFFDGWPVPLTPARHVELLRRSDHVVLARLTSGQVIGFVTAHSDGMLSAYIPLLEVLPAHRGQGVGTELVRRLLERLSGLYMVDLSCDAELEPFYRRLGMVTLDRGMGLRNHSALR